MEREVHKWDGGKRCAKKKRNDCADHEGDDEIVSSNFHDQTAYLWSDARYANHVDQNAHRYQDGTILARLTPPSYNASSMLRRLALIPFTGISFISISIIVERQV